MGRRAIEAGSKPPYAFVIPAGQADAGAVERLVDVLRVGRVEVGQAKTSFSAGGTTYGAGSYVVRMNQPYRAHAKDLLEVQRFPRMEQYPGGPPERPYDVAGWTLPLQMGVTAVQIDQPLSVETTPVTNATPRTRRSSVGYPARLDPRPISRLSVPPSSNRPASTRSTARTTSTTTPSTGRSTRPTTSGSTTTPTSSVTSSGSPAMRRAPTSRSAPTSGTTCPARCR